MGYSPVTRREYECASDGYFEVKRPVSAPTAEVCPACGDAAVRVYTRAPQFALAPYEGERDIRGQKMPNDSTDMVGYEEWQKDTLAVWQDKLQIDNAGPDHVALRKMIKRKARS